MKRILVCVWLGVLLLCATSGFAQTGNAQLGGIVQDPSKALIPGVSITATNVDTQVTATQITNESGAYNFPVLQPGTYRVSAELPGFKKVVNNDVRLSYAGQTRIDFTLEVGAVEQAIEVTVAQDSLMKDSSASVGDVITKDRLDNLPLVGNNVLDLLSTLPGLRINPLGDSYNTIGGLGINSINTTRDGLSIVDGRVDAQNTTYLPGYNAFSPTTLVPDLIGEVRLILSPVDAELGRGNSQVQILTRSGTNKYSGSATWNIRNTALDANTWTNNHTLIDGKPTPLDWNNNHQYTVAYGGPVQIPGLYNGKNKTFFYGLFEQNIHNTRETQTVNVLTDSARLGIFRYFTGYNPAGWNPNITSVITQTPPLTTTNATWVAVDVNGNPVAPPFNPDGSPYTGRLVCLSVFGTRRLDASFNMVPFTSADCPGGQIALPSSGTTWDTYRQSADTSGYMKKILALTPRANYFGGGDGLNIGQYRWQRRREGSNSTQAIIGADLFANNKQYNIKIDHNFNAKHKVAVSYSAQQDDSADNVPQYPGSDINGAVIRRPHVVTVNMVSTLSQHMINEARFGMNRTANTDVLPWFNPNEQIRKKAEDFLSLGSPSVQNPSYSYLTVINNGSGNVLNSNGYMATAGTNVINVNPLYNYADTLSWSRGKHAFKFGGELRLPRSNGNGGINPYPTITLGNNLSATTTASPFANVSNFATELPGFLNANLTQGFNVITAARTNASSLLYWLSGSVSGANQQYWIDDFTDVRDARWEDVSTKGSRLRNEIFKEWAAFVKDDFKVSRRLTLNLGVRWEYYASPYVESGLTTAINDFGYGLFGPSRAASQFNTDPFSIFLKPGDLYLTGYGSSTTNPLACQKGVQQSPSLPVSTCDPNLMTGISFVGPRSPNPGRVAVPENYADIGPAIGFAYSIPWFGEGKTTIRGGYQQTFGAAGVNRGSLGGTESTIANAPGAVNAPGTVVADAAIQSILSTRALNLSDIKTLVPVRPTVAPGGTLPIYGRSGLAPVTYDPNYKTPYTQNATLSITRQVRRNIQVDLRWTGTYGRRQDGTLDTNTVNVYKNPELFQALVDARAGKDPVLLDQMLAGLNLNNTVTSFGPVGTVVNGVYQTGAAHLRRSSALSAAFTTLASNLANGDFQTVANILLTLNPNGLQALPVDPKTGATLTGVGGFRSLRNGCDRLANGYTYVQQTAPGTFVAGYNATNATPLRCFPENYLVSNPQFGGVTYHANLGHSNYNSLQAQITMRPTSGSNVQATWIWAKSMQLPGSGYIDPSNRNLDFARGREGAHSLRVNGTLELPIGPGRFLFKNSSGLVARFVEGWQTSFILNMSTGSPADITTTVNHFYAGSRYQIVSDKWSIPEGKVKWNGPSNNSGTFYGSPSPYIGTADPQCGNRSVVAGVDQMGTNLAASCTLNALALRNSDGSVGELLLVYPEPGKVGNLGARTLNYWGQFSLDANASKRFKLTESKSLQLRVDATNVLNHPTPNLPSFAVTTLGQITGKGNQRRNLQGQVRLNF